MNKTKKIILIVAVCFIAAASGLTAFNINNKVSSGKKNVFLALQYLSDNNNSMAVAYLDKVSSASKSVSFAKDATEIVRQQMNGNSSLCKIEADAASRKYKLSDDQKFILDYVLKGDMSDGYTKIISSIKDLLKLSDKKETKYLQIYTIEKNAMTNGYLDETKREEYKDLCGKEAAIDLALSVALSSNNYSTAFNEAVQLLEMHPSQENRLLVADIAARASYNGNNLSLESVAHVAGVEFDSAKLAKENEKKAKKETKLRAEIDALSMKLEIENDEAKAKKYAEEIASKQDKADALKNEIENPLLYRALNSVVNLQSSEADLVKAKIYLAMGNEKKAEKMIETAASPVMLAFNSNESIADGLVVLSNIIATEGAEGVSKNATNEIENMFSQTVRDGVVVVNNNYYYGNNIASSLASLAVADYKYSTNSIYISGVDDSNYPEIKVSLSGREDLLKAIAKKNNVTVKDTHFAVDYMASIETVNTTSICFVVDVSGSMVGSPLDDAKAALLRFADTCVPGTEMSLVTFSDWGTIVVEPTTNMNTFKKAVSGLYTEGGTDITAGLRMGLTAAKLSAGLPNIILMTDGESGFDYAAIEEAKAMGATVFTVGFGTAQSTLLEEIASALNGTFTQADSSSDLGAVYGSIGAIIGNKIELTYKVSENPDEEERYFFIKLDDFDATDAFTYRKAGNEAKAMNEEFRVYSFLSLPLDFYNNSLNYEGYEYYIYVSKPEWVEKVVVEGKEYPIAEETGVRVNLTNKFSEGLYPVTFKLIDGTEYVAENNIAICDTNREGAMRSNVRAHVGSTALTFDRLYTLANGDVYGTVVTINDYASIVNGEEPTLNALLDSVVLFKNPGAVNETVNERGYEEWGDRLDLEADVWLRITYRDAQNSMLRQDTTGAIGKLSISIDANQCTVTER